MLKTTLNTTTLMLDRRTILTIVPVRHGLKTL